MDLRWTCVITATLPLRWTLTRCWGRTNGIGWSGQWLAARRPFLLLASSTTFQRFTAESWGQSPRAFQRLRALLAPRRGALMVSGDLHRNAVCDDSGVIETVSSAVARVGAVFKAERRNWGLLDFGPAGLQAELQGLKVQDRLSF